jgi:hypothetical protein
MHQDSMPTSRYPLILLATLLSLTMSGNARDWFVSPSGKDGAEGTEQAPLRTVQAALDHAQAGDVCKLRAGTYREKAIFKSSGEEGKPVRLEACPGEAVIFDGTETVKGAWSKYKDSIYKIQLPVGKGVHVEQLFVGRDMMIEARWPNMRFDQRYDRNCWAQVDKGSTHGLVLSKAAAESGIDWAGGMACLNVAHQWWTWNRPVTKHGKGGAEIHYPANLVGLCDSDPLLPNPKKSKERLEEEWGDDYFYLYGKLEALDVETEWFHDPKTGMLYLFAPGGVDPSKLEVRYKALDYALMAKDRHDLEISGINFFGTTFRLDNCNRTLVEKCELLYPSYARTITEYDETRAESVFTKITGDHNTVRHCSLAYANNLGLMVMGASNTVEDCIIHDVNWYGTLIYPALQLSASPSLGVNWFDTIQYPPTPRTIGNTDVTSCGNAAGRNTLFNAGSALLVYQAADTIVEYNHIHDGGLACKDVSLIYGCWPFCHGSVVRYNWVHGCVTDGYSGRGGHGGIGIRADDQSRHNIFHHNVVWDCGQIGITMKGEDNLCFNNTVFNVGETNAPQFDILLEQGAEPVKTFAVQWPQLLRQNQWSEAVNNAAHNITGSHKLEDQLKDSDRVHNNVRNADIATMLVDPDHRDFRPKPGSPLIGAGVNIPGYAEGVHGKNPDVGAYQTGGEKWIPGADWKESFTVLKGLPKPEDD